MKSEIKQRIEQIRRGKAPEGYKKGKLGVVPIEWDEVAFSTLFTSTSDYTNDLERYPIYSLTIEDGVTPKTERYERSHLVKKEDAYKIVRPNDYAYNPMNLRFGAVARHKGNVPVAISGYYDIFTTVYESDLPFMDSFLTCGSMLNYYNRVSTGSLVEKQRVHFSQFLDFVLPLPPVKERAKIASILTTQDKVIELKEKLLAEKQRQKKYLMQQLLTGKRRLPRFSGDWKNLCIENTCDCLDKLRRPINALDRGKIKGEYPYYGANGIVDYIDNYIFNDNLILLAEDGGNFDDFSNSPIATWVCGKVWVNNHAHVLRPKKTFHAKYIFYALEHLDIRKFINGTTRSKLTQADMQQIAFGIPIDIEEQTTIAKVLSTADREIDLLQQDIEQEKQKKKALMQLLLTGIVRVIV